MNKHIPCNHAGCSHTSPDAGGNLNHGALHYTASVMGNPEYLEAVKDVTPAKDQRMVGIERVNAFHASGHEKRVVKQEPKWSR